MQSNSRTTLLSMLYAYLVGVILFQYIFNTVDSDLTNYSRNIDNLSDILDTGELVNLPFYTLMSTVSNAMPLVSQNNSLLLALVASFNAFLIAYCVFKPISSLNRLIILSPLLLCFLFSPKVTDLMVSNLRGGISLAIFIFAMTLKSKILKNSTFFFAILLHQSTSFLLAWLLLYRAQKAITLLKNLPKIKASIVILISAPILILISMIVQPADKWGNGTLYTLMILYLLFLFVIIDRRVLLTEEGFIAIALLVSLMMAFLFDYQSIRLLSWALIFYLIFAVKSLNKQSTQLLFLFYSPMFSAMIYYWFANH